MKENLIVIANSTKVKIYSAKFLNENCKIHFLAEFTHPESQMKNHDLVTDGSVVYNPDHKELEAEKFANQISHYLKNEKSLHHYAEWILIASPHFVGFLNKHLDKFVLQSIKKIIQKDIANINNEQELLELIHQYLSN